MKMCAGKSCFFIASLLACYVGNIITQDLKIVGLLPVRNEELFIANCLRAMAAYTDSIVVLDDVSTDLTLAIVRSLQDECHIERIIEKNVWDRNEQADREILLKAGREIGGTHFMILDADEIFPATCMQDAWLRKRIYALQPGEVLVFPYLHTWGSHTCYRNDEFCNAAKPYMLDPIFADDGSCSYSSNFVWGPSKRIHVNRVPWNLQNLRTIAIPVYDVTHSILHFQYIDLDVARTKFIWYMCLEFIHKWFDSDEQERATVAQDINFVYHVARQKQQPPLFCTTNTHTNVIPNVWYDYKNFDMTVFSRVSKLDEERKKEIVSWMNKYGSNFFRDLDIWRVSWLNEFKKF